MNHKNHKLHDAIGFALNWPTEWEIIRHDAIKKVYLVRYLGGGWEYIKIDDSFIQSCRTWGGRKEWVKRDKTSYEELWGR